MSAFCHSAPENGDIWSIKYAFDSDTNVRQGRIHWSWLFYPHRYIIE